MSCTSFVRLVLKLKLQSLFYKKMAERRDILRLAEVTHQLSSVGFDIVGQTDVSSIDFILHYIVSQLINIPLLIYSFQAQCCYCGMCFPFMIKKRFTTFDATEHFHQYRNKNIHCG